jgi:short-subunit dehydrogenase
MAAQLLTWDTALPITLAIANAGISAGTRLDGAPEGQAAALRQVRVNLLGAMHLVESLLPRMLARGGGQIGLVGSLAGFRGLPDAPAYSASKAGLWAYGEALRAAHGPAGLRVTLLAPGFFDSAMSARIIGPKPFALSQRAAATKVARALRRGVARAVFPWPLGLALRLLALLPAGLSDALVRLGRARVSPEAEE